MEYLKEINGQIKFPYDRQLHVLKHFSKISKKYKKSLIKNLSVKELNVQDSMIGSVFSKEFSDNPIQLLNKLMELRIDIFEIDQQTQNLHLEYSFSKKDYPNGIGVDNLVSMNELTANEVLSIETKNMGGGIIKYIDTSSKSSWNIHLIMTKLGDLYTVITIFPGKYAPPFPNQKYQSKENYNANIEFWKKHAFIT